MVIKIILDVFCQVIMIWPSGVWCQTPSHCTAPFPTCLHIDIFFNEKCCSYPCCCWWVSTTTVFCSVYHWDLTMSCNCPFPFLVPLSKTCFLLLQHLLLRPVLHVFFHVQNREHANFWCGLLDYLEQQKLPLQNCRILHVVECRLCNLLLYVVVLAPLDPWGDIIALFQ